ncbi:MAG: hypothetical protein KGH72_03365 [Candidatus Micrarchaeota archaeon]|nr:hypothetical protein [Candidatus Micrarchaeota archaeon]
METQRRTARLKQQAAHIAEEIPGVRPLIDAKRGAAEKEGEQAPLKERLPFRRIARFAPLHEISSPQEAEAKA